MSELIGHLEIDGLQIALVDWDRPVWFRSDDPMGLRVIPSKDFFVTDAIVAFHLDAVSCCEQISNSGNFKLIDLSNISVCKHLELARKQIRQSRNLSATFTYNENSVQESLISKDLAEFQSSIPINFEVR